jgi:hypothetical protein
VQLQQFSISKKLGIMREKRHGEHAEKWNSIFWIWEEKNVKEFF